MLRIVNHIKSPLQYVPLKQVNIESTIRSFAADVTITQIFRNDENRSIVAIYCFPIEEQAAIYSFTARIDNREIIAQLKAKGDAPVEYTNDSNPRHDAYLLEQDETSQDNFIINVGALPPAKECLIMISYVTELDLIQESNIRFVIPATIAPRYSPQKQRSVTLPYTKYKYVQSSPYTIDFRCRIEKLHGPNEEQYIARLTSPSHHINIDLSIQEAYLVTFTHQNSYLDRDILLDIHLSDKRANTFVVLEANAAMAAVTPFEEDSYLCVDSQQTSEFIFILDCSGSMKNENRIGLAREAMLFFLKNLPNNCYFNIIKFGANYSCLFNKSTAFYNNINVRIAQKFISQIRADLGGTEILAPLQWLDRHPPQTGRARQVFLLTDGEISNVTEVLDLCRSMASSTRIFSFGLGTTPSRSLVKGLARATNGRFVFIPPNTNIDVYVGEQLQKAIQRRITNIRVEWNLGVAVENVPNRLPPAYMDDRLIMYALTNNQTIPFHHKSSIQIRTNQSYYRLGITDSDRITNNTKMIERLAAKALILQLEHCKISRISSRKVRFEHVNDDSMDEPSMQSKEKMKQRIIDLSLRYNILSRYTAFIGIEKHLNDRHLDEVVREVPIQTSIDNQHTTFVNTNTDDIFLTTTTTTTLTSQRSVDRPIHVEDLSPLRHATSNSSVSSPYHMSTTVRSSPTIDNRFASLSDQHKLAEHYSREEEVHANPDEIDPTMDDKNIIYYLLNRQTSNGLWNFSSNRKVINDLTGKPLAVFQSSDTHGNTQILVTAILIILLEVKFITLRSLWEEAVEKARQRLIHLLNNDWKKLIMLFRNIRIILNE